MGIYFLQEILLRNGTIFLAVSFFFSTFVHEIMFKAMNTTVVMNNLLNLIHSMSLSASNKRWLADHLYDEVKTETESKADSMYGWPKVDKKDLVISPSVDNLFKVSEPLSRDEDVMKGYSSYLNEKYK